MSGKIKYAVEQRLRLIDFLLDRYGYVNRGAVVDYFGISAVAASRDFLQYKEIVPDNMVYDPSKKSYLKSLSFKKLYQ